MSTTLALVLAVLALPASTVAAWHALGIGRLRRRTGEFLDDWQGEPARPGVDARPGVPERLAKLEDRTAALNHDVRGELASRLELLGLGVSRLEGTADHNAAALTELSGRVSDHRRRNEQQIDLLREAVAMTQQRLDEVARRGQQRRRTDPPDPARPPSTGA